MSCSSCSKPRMGNDCMFRMSDGRQFTDYRTHCTVNYEKKVNNYFKSNYEERQYLTNNALKLMKEHKDMAEKLNKRHCCFTKDQDGTMLPEKNMIQCNKRTCTFTQPNKQGLGTGRNYSILS